MDSSKIAGSFENSSDPGGSNNPLAQGKLTSSLPARRQEALAMLLEALECVQDLKCGVWDFAVEMSAMRRLKLTNSELRWLIAKGLIDHAIEVTSAGDSQRSFKRPPRPVFCKRTCFVLTVAGAAAATNTRGETAAEPGCNEETPVAAMGEVPAPISWASCVSEPKAATPKWDRDRQELKVGSVVVKRFKVPAANQETILAAFEEEGWPARIDDPLPPHPEHSPKRRLQVTIKSLNRNQRNHLIRFLGDGSGQGVRWEFCGVRDTSAAP